MALRPIDARGFQLTPDIAGSFGRGLQTGQQFQSNRLRNQILQQSNQRQQGQFDREAQIRETLAQFGQQAPQTQQQAQLAAQTAEFAPTADPLGQQVLDEQPQAKSLEDLTREARRIDPIIANQVLTAMGMDEPSQREEASRFAIQVRAMPIDMQNQMIMERAQELRGQGRDPKDTLQLLDMPPEVRQQALDGTIMAALSAKDAVSADLRAQALAAKQVGDAQKAAQPSQVQSAVILDDGTVQIVRKDGTVEIKPADAVGKEIIDRAKERGVDLQQRRAQGRTLGKDAAKTAQKAFEQTTKLRDNNNSLRQVIETVRGGAETGPLAAKLPSFRAESVRLDNLRRKLGLDIIGSVTFGALSEGELELALDTALPTSLDGPELIQWAEDKIAAQEKLAGYLEDQSIFLSEKGNTPAGWIKEQRTRKQDAARVTPPPPGFVLEGE